MIKIFSDGGSDGRGSAAAACIVREKNNVSCFSFYLGEATNNEGEIFSALAGIAYLDFLGLSSGAQLEWIGDSEYALKSASQYIFNWERNGWKTSQKEPVKNQGLWKTFLGLSRDIQLRTTHVKGHSGHIENEACDLAVTWARLNRDQFNGDWLEAPVALGGEPYANWYVRDAREILAEVRALEASGLHRSDFVTSFNFEQIEEIRTKAPISSGNKESIEENLEDKIKKLSTNYLKKVGALSKGSSFLSSEPVLHRAIDDLKDWLKSKN